jgi:tRNA(fMet)-specific endonuclease VapC
MIAFDADILSDILRGDLALVARAAQIDPAQQVVPIVVVEEVIRGRLVVIRQAEAGKGKVTLSQAYDLFEQSFRALAAFRTLAYTEAAAKLFEAFKTSKIRVGTHDLRIAAICIVHGATLVTRNARDYSRIPGLTLIVWG